MSEYEATQRVGSESLAGRPSGGNPGTAAPGTSRGHHFGTEAPRVLARMPDLGPSEAERECQLPSLERDGRLLSSRVSVAVLLGGVALLLAVALVPFVFFGKGKEDKDDKGTWQVGSPAPSASEAPRFGGSADEVPQYPATGGVAPYPRVNPEANTAWGGQSQPGWTPEVASRPAPAAWQSGDPQTPTPNGWNPAYESTARTEPSPPGAWSAPSATPSTPEPSYGWNTQPPSATAPPQATGTAWNTQTPVPSWPNQPYSATGQPPQEGSWNTGAQAVAADMPTSAYGAAAEASRPVGPMMPSTPTGFNSGYEASRSAVPYGGQYRPATDVYRSDPAANPAPPPPQPYNYRSDAGSGVAPVAVPYGGYQAVPANSPTGGMPAQPVQQFGGPTSYQAPYPTPGFPAYPTTDPSSMRPASSIPGGGAPPYGEPGVARFQGVIEKPNARTTYERTRSSIY